MAMHIPKLKIQDEVKVTVFLCWAAFGVIPTIHWYFEMGGAENAMVNVSAIFYLVSKNRFDTDMPIYLADLYSTCDWNVRFVHHRICHLRNENTREMDHRKG